MEHPSVRDIADARAELTARTDADLLERLHAGDQAMLGVLYDRHAALVYGTALAIVRSADEAQDLTQEVFLALCSEHLYDPGRGPLSGYLLSMTRSRGIDRLRRRGRHLRLLERWYKSSPPTPPPATPLQQVSTNECTERVRSALAGLSDREREVLELAYYKGLTQAEIAAELGAPLGTVKTWARRGLLSLRDSLSDLVG